MRPPPPLSGRGSSACPCSGGILGGGDSVVLSNTALGDGESREKAPRDVHPDGFISL